MSKEKLKIVNDVVLYKDEIVGRHKYFMFSEKKNKYLKITHQQYKLFQFLVPYFNGKYTEEQLTEQVKIDIGKTVNIHNVVNIIEKYGLWEKSKRDEISKIELELYGYKVKKFYLESIQKKHQTCFRAIYISMFCLFIFLLVWNVLIFYKNGFLFSRFNRMQKVDWNYVSIMKFIFILLLSYFSILGHELGHFCASSYYNVKVKSVTFLLKFGLIPVFYVRYKDLYKTRSWTKIKILLAGVTMNIVQIEVFSILYYYTSDWEYFILLIINVSAVASNLSPLSLSDGYHIATTLFNMEGFRWNIIIKMGLVLNGKKPIKTLFCKENFGYLLYAGISYAFTIRVFYTIIISTLQVLNVAFVGRQDIKIIAIAFICISIGVYTGKFIKIIYKFKE